MSETIDGRRLRSADSRARIVAAMLELIHAGEVTPGAEQVAARAEVGLRTVFRHFKDMDSLYREMTEVISAEARAIAVAPFVSTDWRDKLDEFIARRSRVFERIGPFKRAVDIHRHRSEGLAMDSTLFARELRAILQREMPPAVRADGLIFEALDLMLSFEVWSRLRREQGLSVAEACQVLRRAVARIAG